MLLTGPQVREHLPRLRLRRESHRPLDVLNSRLTIRAGPLTLLPIFFQPESELVLSVRPSTRDPSLPGRYSGEILGETIHQATT
jgi:hypothetical protein